MTQEEQDPVAVGAELRRKREAAGQTQDAVARELGTTQQTIDRIERGETRHSRFLLPLKLLWEREDWRDQAEDARRAAAPERPLIPVYQWRAGRMESGTTEQMNAPDRFLHPLRGYQEGYAVRIMSPVFSPSADAIFHAGDILFVLPGAIPQHGRWSVVVSGEDPQDVRIGMIGDPAVLPPGSREHLSEWGYLVPEEGQAVHSVVSFQTG